MWLTKLKIAIVEKNTDVLDGLLNETPKFSDAKEIQEAMYLLREASELLYSLKDETAVSMKQLKKNLSFLKSTQVQPSAKLDIRL
ncbi:MAG: hypothetical protein J7L21_02555 [Sulfurimonas sp.]|nr:hypothetical protein [Sulfurimonas sp.]